MLNEYENPKSVSGFCGELLQNVKLVNVLVPLKDLVPKLFGIFEQKELFYMSLLSAISKRFGMGIQEDEKLVLQDDELRILLQIAEIIFEKRLLIFGRQDLVKSFTEVC